MDDVKLTLKPAEFDYIVNALRQRPHAEVHEFILKLVAQANEGRVPPQEAPALTLPG